jgi:hypothetical protein
LNKRNVRILFGIEEVFALPFVVIHPASSINGVGINFDVEYAGRGIRGREGQRGLPLAELAFNRNRGLHKELNIAFFRGDGEDGTLGAAY